MLYLSEGVKFRKILLIVKGGFNILTDFCFILVENLEDLTIAITRKEGLDAC